MTSSSETSISYKSQAWQKMSNFVHQSNIGAMTYAQATQYIQHCILSSNIITDKPTCPIDLIITRPDNVELPMSGQHRLSIKPTTDLATLIMKLQIEVDLISNTGNTRVPTTSFGPASESADGFLISVVEIILANDQMSGMPLLTGELFGAQEDGKSAICVSWDCRNGVDGCSLADYWEEYRSWLLKISGTTSKKPKFRIATVLQDLSVGGGHAKNMGKGHHFVKSLDDLPNHLTTVQTSNVATQATYIPPDSYPPSQIENRTIAAPDDGRYTHFEAVREDYTNIDHMLVTMTRVVAASSNIPFRPTTPELVLVSKILCHGRGIESLDRPGYEDMMRMHEEMMHVGYRPLPTLMIQGDNMSFEDDQKIKWSVYQNMGGDLRARNLLRLRDLVCGSERDWRFVESHDPAYTNPYGVQRDAEWASVASMMEGGNVEMIPMAKDVDYEALLVEGSAANSPKTDQGRRAFRASKAFDSDDDETFCVGKPVEIASIVPKSEFAATIAETKEEQDQRRRRKVAYDIAKFNAERYGSSQQSNRSSYQAVMSAYNPKDNQLNGAHQSDPSNEQVRYQTPVCSRVPGLRAQEPYPVHSRATTAISTNENVADTSTWATPTTTPLFPMSSNHLFTPTHVPATMTFNPTTPVFQFSAAVNHGTLTTSQSVTQPPRPIKTSRTNTTSPTKATWHNFNFNQFQPPNDLASHPLRAPGSIKKQNSPFTHRYPVRYDSQSGALPNTSTATIASMRSPVPVLQTANPQGNAVGPVFGTVAPPLHPRSAVPVRKHTNPPDQSYGSSLRLLNVPMVKHSVQSIMRTQQRAVAAARAAGTLRGTKYNGGGK